jgi:hypothetical protein
LYNPTARKNECTTKQNEVTVSKQKTLQNEKPPHCPPKTVRKTNAEQNLSAKYRVEKVSGCEIKSSEIVY